MSSSDERPAVWVGHVALPVVDVAASRDCLVKLGCRLVEQGDGIAILELRGGTHLLLLRSDEPVPPGAPAPFDLMVDDVDAARKRCAELGLEPSEVQSVPYHRCFTLTEPSGHEITINSTHVSGKPV